MRTRPGWHGYWLNPGDAGLPMSVEWTLPAGWSVGAAALPGAEPPARRGHRQLCLRARLCRAGAPEGAGGRHRLRADLAPRCAGSPAPTRFACPRRARCRSTSRPAAWRRRIRASTNGAARCRARWPARPISQLDRRQASRSRSRCRASVDVGEPYFFPADDGPVDYAAPQKFRRDGDMLIAELKRRRGEPRRLARRARAWRRARARVHGGAGRRSRRRHAGRRARCAVRLVRDARRAGGRDPAQPDALRLPDPGA